MTTDLMSIRARRSGGKIKYRIVDDNGTGEYIKYSPKESIYPLTLGKLIALIDGAYYEDSDYYGLARLSGFGGESSKKTFKIKVGL